MKKISQFFTIFTLMFTFSACDEFNKEREVSGELGGQDGVVPDPQVNYTGLYQDLTQVEDDLIDLQAEISQHHPRFRRMPCQILNDVLSEYNPIKAALKSVNNPLHPDDFYELFELLLRVEQIIDMAESVENCDADALFPGGPGSGNGEGISPGLGNGSGQDGQ